MKIGDKVRFLNEVGGGVISGFDGKDIVIIEDEDGFDIPVRRNECVLVESMNIQKLEAAPKAMTSRNDKTTKADDEDVEDERPVTFKPVPMERKGGDLLNLFLCFSPLKVQELSETDFDIYLVNDSNYFIDYTWLCRDMGNWKLHQKGTIEPNTKLWMETIERSKLNDLAHMCFQIVAYKEDKYFMLKSPQSIDLNPDLTRFYKLHTFAPNMFFEERVLTYDLMRDDKPVRHTFFQAEEIKDVLLGKEPKAAAQAKLEKVPRKQGEKLIETIDLHASELLETTNGMSAADILEYQVDVFHKKMEEIKKQKGKQIVFIHGKGNGELRKAILHHLRMNYPGVTYQDASFLEYGFGATLITIK